MFGDSISETFGWSRNHYDRLVHFCFGLFFTLPTRELVLRFVRPARGYAITIAVLFILGASAFYELLEWWAAVLLGGNVRVGLEDNLYLEPGVFASNAQLVERALEIIRLLGGRNLGPEETRQRLDLQHAG